VQTIKWFPIKDVRGTVIVDEELGYPHELILEALNQSTPTLNGQYRYRVKLLAAIVKQLLGNEKTDITYQNSSDPVVMLLESFVKKSHVKDAIQNFSGEFGKAIEDYSQNPIDASYEKVLALLKEGLLLHIICKESFKIDLLLPEELANFSSVIDFKENETQAIVSAIRLWTAKKSGSVPYSMILEFTRLKDEDFQVAALFLSFELAEDNTEFKRELLYSHYLLVKKVVNDFRSIFGQQSLTDQVLENMFKTAIILFYCGYSNSLRLPQQEGIAYTADVLNRESFQKLFRKAFDEAGNLRVTQIHLKVELWELAFLDLILLLLHWFHEVYTPLQATPFGIQITIPEIPAFLVAAIIVTAILVSYLYRLEGSITNMLKRGKIAS
jgi:hypothetical protein